MTTDRYTMSLNRKLIHRYVEAMNGWFCYVREEGEWYPEGFSSNFPTDGCNEQILSTAETERVICLEDLC